MINKKSNSINRRDFIRTGLVAILGSAIVGCEDLSVTLEKSDYGELTGKVICSSNHPVSGAKIKIQHSDLREKPRERTTNRGGEFYFDDVLAGSYEIVSTKNFGGKTGARYSLDSATVRKGSVTDMRITIDTTPYY